MNRFVKRILSCIFASVCLINVGVSLVGCKIFFDNGTKEILQEHMEKILPEVDGYELVKSTREDSVVGFEGSVFINGEPILITKSGGEDYVIQYKNKTITINDEFMRLNSEVYVEIHSIWINYYSQTTSQYARSRIYSVFVYDNNLFIITNGLFDSLSGYNVAGKYPITLYLYDFDSSNILYVDYYSDFMKGEASLKVLKKA